MVDSFHCSKLSIVGSPSFKTVTIFVILTESNTEITLVSFPDRVILAFMFGFLVQEVLAANREGFHVYKSKWWNVVDSLIIVAFVVSYVIWYSRE